MLDYVSVGTNDLARATAFYEAALKPLGYEHLMTSPEGPGFGPPPAAGAKAKCYLWVGPPYDGQPARAGNGNMIAFTAPSRAAVDAFHAAALAAGGTDEGAPGLRKYAPDWYGAYVRDPDGNKLCAVCRRAE